MNQNQKNEESLKITKIPYDVLLTRTVSERREFEKRRYYQALKKSGMSDSVRSRIKFSYHPENYETECLDPRTLNRWQVNYTRHVLTNYEDLCAKLDRMSPEDHVSYLQLRRRAFELISKVYPQLSEECEQQIHLTDLRISG